MALVFYVWCLLESAGLSVDDVDHWLLYFFVQLLRDFVIFEPTKVIVAAGYWSLGRGTLPYY